MIVYISGPITKGPRPQNIHNAVVAATTLRKAGHLPIVPHLFELWDLIDPQPYSFWMGMDLELIDLCQAVVRLPGESSGSEKEIKYAESRKIPVYYGVKDFIQHTTPCDRIGGCLKINLKNPHEHCKCDPS